MCSALLRAACLQEAAPLSGELLEAIKAKWGSQDKFIAEFNAKTAAVQVGNVHLTKVEFACRQIGFSFLVV